MERRDDFDDDDNNINYNDNVENNNDYNDNDNSDDNDYNSEDKQIVDIRGGFRGRGGRGGDIRESLRSRPARGGYRERGGRREISDRLGNRDGRGEIRGDFKGRGGREDIRGRGGREVIRGRDGRRHFLEKRNKYENEFQSINNYSQEHNDNEIFFTHFVSFPISDPKFIQNYNDMTYQLSEQNPKGLSPYLFQKSTKLHILIDLLDLSDQSSEKCRNVLCNLQEDIKAYLNDRPLVFKPGGYNFIGEDIYNSRGVYVSPLKSDEGNRIGKVIDIIHGKLLEKNILAYENLKDSNFGNTDVEPKIVLMNSFNRFNVKKIIKKKTSFNSSYIIPKLENFILPQFLLDTIQLATINTDKLNSDYIVIDNIKIA